MKILNAYFLKFFVIVFVDFLQDIRKVILMENINKVIDGVGKDAEIITNEAGGKQSKSPLAMHLIDPDFMVIINNIDDNVLHEVVDVICFYMRSYEEYYLTSAIKTLSRYIDKDIFLTIGEVLKEGAERYAPNNWRLIPQEEHINHALIHCYAYSLGDRQDNHLEHCMCRLMMAYCTKCSPNFKYQEYVPEGVS